MTTINKEMSQVKNLILATSNLMNETELLGKINFGLQINLSNLQSIAAKLKTESARLIDMFNLLQNKTSFLLTATALLQNQANHQENRSSDFETTLGYLADSLNQSTRRFLRKSNNLENVTSSLLSGTPHTKYLLTLCYQFS